MQHGSVNVSILIGQFLFSRDGGNIAAGQANNTVSEVSTKRHREIAPYLPRF
jgi:hypothetical protein